MKKAYHKIKGKDIRGVCISGAGRPYAPYLSGWSVSQLNTEEIGHTNTIRIKIPIEKVHEMINQFVFTIAKRKTLWWIEDIQYVGDSKQV